MQSGFEIILCMDSLKPQILDKCYVNDIQTRGLRNIGDINIHLGKKDNELRHLLITGDNGVGKTTFVRQLFNDLMNEEGGNPLSMLRHYAKNAKVQNELLLLEYPLSSEYLSYIKNNIGTYLKECKVIPDCLHNPEYYAAVDSGMFLVLYFGARRKENFVTPDGPKKIAERTGSNQFIQMMVNLRTQAAFAFQSDDKSQVEKIDNWFMRLNDALSDLLGHDDFKLEFDPKQFNFSIREKDKEPYHFTQLSDGYSAIISIISELMLRMTTNPAERYDMPGIVIIDEIETHLHISLQKKILPFLVKMFPRMQFIVTTHSPFVLSSIENAEIYDLGKKKQFEDFSNYSYSNIVEGFYNIGSYSNLAKSEFERMKTILSKNSLSDKDRMEIADFDVKLNSMSDFQPIELQNKWLSLKLKNISKLS